MYCAWKWVRRTIAWLVFTLAVAGLGSHAIELGMYLFEGMGKVSIVFDLYWPVYAVEWIIVSILLMLWYQWKDAE